jgi:hypothetical protein
MIQPKGLLSDPSVPVAIDSRALIADLGSSEETVRLRAASALRSQGRAAWEALRLSIRNEASTTAHEAAARLLSDMVDAEALVLLKSGQVRMRIQPMMVREDPKWRLIAKSDLLPYVRVYGYANRYPVSVVLDCWSKSDIQPVDEEKFESLIASASLAPMDEEDAREVALFFIALSTQPYAATEQRTTVRMENGEFRISVVYQRTVPCGSFVAGARTDEIEDVFLISPSGSIRRLPGEPPRTLSTNPPDCP